jgi:hypothetical protein
MSRFWQELKSVSQVAKLLNSLATRVRVLCNKKEVELDHKEVIPTRLVVQVLVLVRFYRVATIKLYSVYYIVIWQGNLFKFLVFSETTSTYFYKTNIRVGHSSHFWLIFGSF